MRWVEKGGGTGEEEKGWAGFSEELEWTASQQMTARTSEGDRKQRTEGREIKNQSRLGEDFHHKYLKNTHSRSLKKRKQSEGCRVPMQNLSSNVASEKWKGQNGKKKKSKLKKCTRKSKYFNQFWATTTQTQQRRGMLHRPHPLKTVQWLKLPGCNAPGGDSSRSANDTTGVEVWISDDTRSQMSLCVSVCVCVLLGLLYLWGHLWFPTDWKAALR